MFEHLLTNVSNAPILFSDAIHTFNGCKVQESVFVVSLSFMTNYHIFHEKHRFIEKVTLTFVHNVHNLSLCYSANACNQLSTKPADEEHSRLIPFETPKKSD